MAGKKETSKKDSTKKKVTEENELAPIDQFFFQIKADIEELCGECSYDNGVLRAMVHNLGLSESNAILEAVLEGLDNGEDLPYPALYFHFTLAKNIEEENFENISYLISQLNMAFTLGDYKSFGYFGLHRDLKQIYYGYRMPFNIGALENEHENVRFVLATIFDQLEIFVDFVLYIADGHKELTLDRYMEYLQNLRDYNNLDERADAFIRMIDETLTDHGKEQ